MNTELAHVDFGIIRYANCWEDAGVLIHALKDSNPQRIAIIASAGDNALALLANTPKEVLAFDISLPQLYLTELKQLAFSRLEYDELLSFVGVRLCTAQQRFQLFQHLSPHLSADAKRYWQERQSLIENGLIHCGKFERYFSLFRRWCLPFVHSRKTVGALLQPKSDEAQKAFYDRHWNNRRWQLLMQVFFSKAMMGRVGRDPQFLKQVALSVPQYIRRKAAEHLQSSEATHNHFLHYIFTGNFGAVLPHYLRPENHEAIRANIGRLTLKHTGADEVVAMQAHDAYCLSNIFEYFPQEHFEATVSSWKELLQPGTMLLYWNLMVPRSFSQLAPAAFRLIESDAHVMDAGFFYSAFLAEQKL